METISWLNLLTTLASSKAGEVAFNTLTNATFWEKVTSLNPFKKEEETPEIIILGYSGVGKTQFRHSLRPETEREMSKQTKFVETHAFKINGIKFNLVDTVGQAKFPEGRSDIFQEKFSNKKLIGVINVVSYGYQERQKLVSLTDGKPTKDIITDAVLEGNRDKELEYLEEWLDFLKIEDTSVRWIITLVNKMDVWGDKANIVQNYYESDDEKYQQAFGKRLKNRKIPIHHDVLPYSSFLRRFRDELVIQIGEYEKDLLQKHFKQTLLDVINKAKKA